MRYRLTFYRIVREFHECFVEAGSEAEVQSKYDDGELWDDQADAIVLDEHSVRIEEIA